MWDLPGPGLEPVSPALAGRFLTTVPPGKPEEEVLDEKTSANMGLCTSVYCTAQIVRSVFGIWPHRVHIT